MANRNAWKNVRNSFGCDEITRKFEVLIQIKSLTDFLDAISAGDKFLKPFMTNS